MGRSYMKQAMALVYLEGSLPKKGSAWANPLVPGPRIVDDKA